MAWTCTCGQENEGKFCIACGSPAPVVEEASAEPVSQQSVKPDDFKPAPMHPEKVNNSSNSYSSSSAAPAEPGKTQAVIALILSLVGILPCLGISSIVGLILAIVSKKRGYTGGMGTAALIISIVTMVLSFIFTLLMVIFVANNA